MRRRETYRAARRKGWKVVNDQRPPGVERIPWAQYNEAVTDEMRHQGYYSRKEREARRAAIEAGMKGAKT